MVKGLVPQIATLSIFNGGLKLKSIHHNYQIIQKKLKHVLVLKKRICLQGYNQSLLKKKLKHKDIYYKLPTHLISPAIGLLPQQWPLCILYPITFVIVVGKKIDNLFYTL